MCLSRRRLFAMTFLLMDGAHARGINTKIVKGPRAKVNEDPFAVYITYNNSQVCGGALVSNQFVLTLLTCVSGRDLSLLEVTAGDWKLWKKEDGEQVRNVTLTVNYPGNTNTSADVVLLLLSDPVDTSLPNIGTISPIVYEPSMNELGVLAAYGDSGRENEYKQSLDVVTMEGEACEGFITGISRCWEPKDARQKKNKKACTGDRGSPVAMDVTVFVAELVGINLASSCTSPQFAARKTDDLVDWVAAVANQ